MKPIYLPSNFRCNRNGRLVENRKKSANIWLCLRKGFQGTLDAGGLFKLKREAGYRCNQNCKAILSSASLFSFEIFSLTALELFIKNNYEH